MKMKGKSEKTGLKLNIHKTKTMASGPITSWQIDGETAETGTDFILGGSKIKSVTVSTYHPFICHEVMGLDAVVLVL